MTDEYFDKFSPPVFYNIILFKIDGLEIENTRSNYLLFFLILHFWESKYAKIMKLYDVTKRFKKNTKMKTQTQDFHVYLVGRGGQTNNFFVLA